MLGTCGRRSNGCGHCGWQEKGARSRLKKSPQQERLGAARARCRCQSSTTFDAGIVACTLSGDISCSDSGFLSCCRRSPRPTVLGYGESPLAENIHGTAPCPHVLKFVMNRHCELGSLQGLRVPRFGPPPGPSDRKGHSGILAARVTRPDRRRHTGPFRYLWSFSVANCSGSRKLPHHRQITRTRRAGD